MTVFATKNISIGVDCPLDIAYDFLYRPENFPRWASGLCKSISRQDGYWVAETPNGPLRVDFTEWNKFGIIDHIIHVPNGEVYVPLRLLPNGAGCEVLFTLFRTPDMNDEKFEQDAEWVKKDLASVKVLLESLAGLATVDVIGLNKKTAEVQNA